MTTHNQPRSSHPSPSPSRRSSPGANPRRTPPWALVSVASAALAATVGLALLGLSSCAQKAASEQQAANQPGATTAADMAPIGVGQSSLGLDPQVTLGRNSAVAGLPPYSRGLSTLSESEKSEYGNPKLLGDIPLVGSLLRAGSAAAAPDAFRDLRRQVDLAGSLPGLQDEVWVIQRARPAGQPGAGDDRPGSGALVTTDPNQPAVQIPLPLKHTDVTASIAGNIAGVTVTQQFANPFNTKIEAVYVFPLPENAAINDFVMTIGDRRIRGVIRDRDEARQVYEAARSQGYAASLLQQERPNIFTQKVANIEPGRQIDVGITYFNTLEYVDGGFEFVLPMVVGPRYNPPSFYDGVAAVGREQGAREPGASGQPVEVSYLRPGERSGHDINVSINLSAGMPISAIESRSHVIDVTRGPQPTIAAIRLSSRDSIPNKDLVVRYTVAGDALRSGVTLGADKDGGQYLQLLLVPPAATASLKRAPVELVFVLDCSGSMQGRPIEQAVAAVVRGLRRLDPSDTFQIINFASTASQLGSAPVPATDANIARGVRYAQGLFGAGGTEMLNGLRASLDFPHDPRRLRFVCFLTDGYIGNENEILGEIQARLGASRIFSFGVGTSVNRYLIDSMGRVGRGCVAHVAAGDAPETIMDAFFDRISRPALTDIALDFGGLDVAEVYPSRLSDLFVGRALTVTAKLKPGAAITNTTLRIRGKQGGADAAFEIPLTVSGVVPPARHEALPSIWARAKIAALADATSPQAMQENLGQIKQTALSYNLMSAFTSFVAVDSLAPTQGAFGVTVPVAVPVPDGVRYDSAVR